MKNSMVIISAVLSIFLYASEVLSSPTFYTAEGNILSGDLAFQSAAKALGPSNYLIEEDFDTGWSDSDPVDIVTMGPIALDFSLPGFADEAIISTEGILGRTGQYGTFYYHFVVNYYGGSRGDTIRIDFSGGLVQGFGTWIHDDYSTVDAFRMAAWTIDGLMGISPAIDANPGSPDDIVEGFIGVTAISGLDYVIIENVLNHQVPFELDHIQVVVNPDPTAPIPLPTTILLLGSGLIGLIGIRRKLKKG